jgi:hypothetical protein
MTTLLESIFLDKLLADKQRLKLLSIAWRHDPSIDIHVVSKLGPRPSEQDIATAWDLMLDKKINEIGEPDLIADPKYKEWITKLYTNGRHHSGTLLDNVNQLESWHLLSQKNLLKTEHTDLNRIRSIEILERIINGYHAVLDKIKAERELEKLKRNVQQIVLIDNERFFVAIPLNYAACYSFNYTGHNSRYCTGASDGRHYFTRYSSNGPIVTIIDKKNLTNKNGKWQLHPATGQFANSDQTVTGASADRQFAKQYPGLYKEIVAAIQAKSADIQQSSMLLSDRGYNMPSIIKKFATEFPISYKSVPVSEQMLSESSEVLDQFKDLPGAEQIIKGMHKSGKLLHNQKLTTVDKLDVKGMRDTMRNRGYTYYIFVRGTQDLGIIALGSGKAYVYTDKLEQFNSNNFNELTSWLKTHIGKIVNYSYADNAHNAVTALKSKRERLKSKKSISVEPELLAMFMISKLKPLIAKNIERAIADIKGFINTLVKHSNYGKLGDKVQMLKKLEEYLEKIEMTQDYNSSFIMSKMVNAVHAAALHHYPEIAGGLADGDRHAGNRYGYTVGTSQFSYRPVQDQAAVKQLLQDIKNGDTQKIGTILAFFRQELVRK